MNTNSTIAPAHGTSDADDPTINLGTVVSVTEGVIVKRNTDRSDNLYFLFIPLAVLVTIVLLSVVVYLMARRRHKILPKYSYLPSFSFESSDLDDDREDRETEYLLKGAKLRIGNAPHHTDASTIYVGSSSAGRHNGGRELFA
uniref:Protein with signal anchor n=1 Tax=Anopheles braziliensis TaxID=58242 RepID=A0A2M3ZK44_9DIPT